MKSDTQTASVSAPADRVFDFVSDPANLPKWAVGFAKSIRRRGSQWIVTTNAGEMGLRIESDRNTGVVDFVMTPAPGVEARAASRVLPRGEGSEYVFTQFQQPGMPDESFTQNVRSLTDELRVLEKLFEAKGRE